ncbi:hypothetical protein B2K_39035 [Paenibacillus mucilaginosus K02]|uniref:Uncharacterized protein n=1 Tax=Paenibacillus mucilaginosus K02 TaxID=997761 RepID=R9UP94_9BACL|nr:hypothetical protein B2K_39035 [Paenibacillus mucilaginosus K02]
MRNVKMAGRTISLGIGYSQDEGGGGQSRTHDRCSHECHDEDL